MIECNFLTICIPRGSPLNEKDRRGMTLKLVLGAVQQLKLWTQHLLFDALG